MNEDEIEAQIFNLHDEIDHIVLQLAENLSWRAKADHARKKKSREVARLKKELSILRRERWDSEEAVGE